ncbi:MAG: DUF4013 domain-containing protein [Acidobacteriota bacterium]
MSAKWWVAVPGRGPEPLQVHESVGPIPLPEDALIWSPGLWRWERAADWREWNRRLELTAPEEAPPAVAPELSFLEKCGEGVRDIRRQLRAKTALGQIWATSGKAWLRALRQGDGDGTRWSWRDLVALITSLFERQGKVVDRLSWFVVLQFLPLAGVIINRGWRIDLMRSVAVGGSFPKRDQLGRHMADGLLLWAFYILYLLPQVFVMALTKFSWLETSVALVWWALEALVGSTHAKSLGDILVGGALRYGIETMVFLAYPAALWPFFRGAMIRYAMEDDWRVFLQLRRNAQLAKLHFATLARIYLAEKTLWAAYLLAVMIIGVVTAGLGLLVVPILLVPLRMIASGAIYLKGASTMVGMKNYFSNKAKHVPGDW